MGQVIFNGNNKITEEKPFNLWSTMLTPWDMQWKQWSLSSTLNTRTLYNTYMKRCSYIYLSTRLLDALLDGNGHSFEQLHQLQFLLFSHCDVSELGWQREHPEQLNLTQRWLQQLVIRSHCLMGDVVMTGYTTQLSNLKINQWPTWKYATDDTDQQHLM